MTDTAIRIISLKVPDKSLGVFFMGQAGVVLKSPGGELLAVDLYLSDCCNRYFGFKRMLPYLIGVTDVHFDHIAATHAHYDHFDPDAMPFLLQNGAKLYAALDCRAECDRLGIKEMTPLTPGNAVEAGDYSILPVLCDHGKDTPHAVGLYITCSGVNVYITGDTCLNTDVEDCMNGKPVDIMFAPINGAFGNLDSASSAQYFSAIKPRLCVPCHYGNFVSHGGSITEFDSIMREKHPDLIYRIMAPGELEIIKALE